MTKKQKKIIKVIKLIRESFHESVAVYTCGRCYQFACILECIFDGVMYESGGHVVCNIDGIMYDISGIVDNDIKYIKLSEESSIAWDANYHSGDVNMFMKRYRES